jgi:hypothetical protein
MDNPYGPAPIMAMLELLSISALSMANVPCPFACQMRHLLHRNLGGFAPFLPHGRAAFSTQLHLFASKKQGFSARCGARVEALRQCIRFQSRQR